MSRRPLRREVPADVMLVDGVLWCWCSGKSSLLAAIAGEMVLQQGRLWVREVTFAVVLSRASPNRSTPCAVMSRSCSCRGWVFGMCVHIVA